MIQLPAEFQNTTASYLLVIFKGFAPLFVLIVGCFLGYFILSELARIFTKNRIEESEDDLEIDDGEDSIEIFD